jgi:hypothetical protein
LNLPVFDWVPSQRVDVVGVLVLVKLLCVSFHIRV